MTNDILTPRIRLRRGVPADIPGLMEGLNNWTIAQWLPSPPYPYTEKDAEAFIVLLTAEPPPAYVVADQETDECLGVLGLTRHGDTAEIGYWLRLDAQRKGLMVEAVTGCLAAQTGLSLVFATVDETNGASIRLLEACGFSRVDDHRRATPNQQGSEIVRRYERHLLV